MTVTVKYLRTLVMSSTQYREYHNSTNIKYFPRYGHIQRPQFFPGSLDDALSDACSRPVDERRMLAIYLHHDSSVLTNVFCTQVLENF